MIGYYDSDERGTVYVDEHLGITDRQAAWMQLGALAFCVAFWTGVILLIRRLLGG
jgi:hypothetical protein